MSIALIDITQSKVSSLLYQWLKNQRMPHTLLFFGPPGSGKSFYAHHFAQDFLCQDPQESMACQHCLSCRAWRAGTHPDYHRVSVDPGNTIGIDTTRKMQEIACWKPVYSSKSLLVIDDIHQMSAEAYNSILKTIEEPYPSVSFILTSSKIAAIPSTILSRAVRIPFQRLSKEQLEKTMKEESADPIWKEVVTLLAHGNLKKALNMLKDDQRNEVTQWIQDLGRLLSDPTASFPLLPKNKTDLCLDVWKIILREWYKMKLTASQSSILWREDMMAIFLKTKCSVKQLLNIQEKLIQLEIEFDKTRINAKSNIDFWMISSRQMMVQ